jgi:hypothetical protein
MAVRFGCGEYVPGGEPITVPNLPVPAPPVIIPDPPILTISIPFVTGRPGGGDPPGGGNPPGPGFGGPGEKRWECYTQFTRLCPDRITIEEERKICKPCTKVPTSILFGPALVWSTDCKFKTVAACQSVCISTSSACITPVLTGSTVSRPGGPITGGGSTGYKCNSVDITCPKPNQGKILRTVRNCTACNVGSVDPDCISQTLAQCQAAGCTDTIYPNIICDESSIISVATEVVGGGGSISTGSSRLNIPVAPNVVGGGGSISTGSPRFNVNVIDVGNQGVSREVIQPTPTQSEIYNNSLNFFVITSPRVGVPPIQGNSKYLEVFKPAVATPVGVLLDAEGTVGTWIESTLFSMTHEHIKASINPSLLAAFQVIHYPGGQLVGENSFLKMLEKHLLTGSMSEFDSHYYLELANKQSEDRKIKYTGLGNVEAAERAGLGTLAAGSILADADSQVNLRKRQIRRQRRLNTDIKANIPVKPLVGAEKSLYLTDAGICSILVDQSVVAIPTGDGDGYYLQIDLSQGDCTPLVTISDFSSTYFVPPEVRFNALTLFNTSPKITLTASSLTGDHELISNDTGVRSLEPIYMPLDLNSMGYTTNKNPLIAEYEGVYRTETDQEIIDEHTTNNGLAITRVNIDYRDPLYRYILDSSSVSLNMNDITFKSIKESKNFKGGVRLSRNIPFGLIITPVVGSRHNPFNGFSTMQSFNEKVVRKLSFTMDINTNDTAPQKPQLSETILYNKVAGALKIGLVEPADSQNVVHRFAASSSLYTDTFFSEGKYTTSSTTVSSYGISYLVKDVLDYLINTYDPEDIMWFDALRRMPLNKVGELLYDTNIDLLSSLERGLRNEMQIHNVIRSENNPVSDVLADDEKTIIKVADRNVNSY